MTTTIRTTRSRFGAQLCRGAIERGAPLHTCTEYTTLHYSDGRRFHFCDDHPPAAADMPKQVNILILACSSTKRPQSTGRGPAWKVYDGPAWRMLRKFERDHPLRFACDLNVFALSAQYGLIRF